MPESTDPKASRAEAVAQWLALRKEAAKTIEPTTAEVIWTYGYTLDPYGVYDLAEEEKQMGREYFARTPDSDIWVSFDDLSDEVRSAIWEKHKSVLAFPAGLPLDLLRHAERSDA